MPGLLFAAFVTALTFAFIATKDALPIQAHEGREVGLYNLVAGFKNEPAYEGLINAVSLKITVREEAVNHMQTEEDGDDEEHRQMPSYAMSHGALFVSGGLDRGDEFEFIIEDDMKGKEIMYHIHPGNHEGIIKVNDRGSGDTSKRTVVIHADTLDPPLLEVNPGDTIIWRNDSGFNASVMSGPLSSMAPEPVTMNQVSSARPSITAVSDASLQVEVTHLATGSSKTMPMQEIMVEAGHYTAEFIPTATGDYVFRFFGNIDGFAIDETFQSGDGTFDTVVSSDEIQFPRILQSPREVENAARGASDVARTADQNASDATDTARIAIIIAIISIVAGLSGLGFGVAALTMYRRRR